MFGLRISLAGDLGLHRATTRTIYSFCQTPAQFAERYYGASVWDLYIHPPLPPTPILSRSGKAVTGQSQEKTDRRGMVPVEFQIQHLDGYNYYDLGYIYPSQVQV